MRPRGSEKTPGSGRRKGVPNRLGADVRVAARTYTRQALATLAGIMNDPKAPAQARAMAADRLLDRGWGKPTQPIGAEDRQPIIVKIMD
jgi:hypothetical protein